MPFPRRLLMRGEEVLLDLRPHWISLAAPLLVTVLVLVLWLVALPRIAGGEGSARDFLLWVTIAAGLVILVYPVWAFIRWATSHFVVTTDRVISRHGLLARESMEIPLEAVSDVRFRQGVLERTIGAGDLIFESAGERGRQVFSNVRDPEGVQRTIHEAREANQRRGFSGPPRQARASVSEELERLADLRDRGVLNEQEFQAEKSRLLRGSRG